MKWVANVVAHSIGEAFLIAAARRARVTLPVDFVRLRIDAAFEPEHRRAGAHMG